MNKMRKEDKLYESGQVHEDFTFNDTVAEVFDDMLSRSVPFYGAVIDGIAGLLRQHASRSTTVYDLGCSTGTTLLELTRLMTGLNLQFIGVDNAPAMISKARRKAEMFSKSAVIHFIEEDINTVDLNEADVILCNYTLQFIRPMTRPHFVRRIYDALPPGGLLIISEKVLSHDKSLNRKFIEMYHDYKRKRGYSELEIAAKREALENVLVPFSIEENRGLLQDAGFDSVETFFQWFNFTSFIAVQ